MTIIPSVIEMLSSEEYGVSYSAVSTLDKLANHGELNPNMIGKK